MVSDLSCEGRGCLTWAWGLNHPLNLVPGEPALLVQIMIGGNWISQGLYVYSIQGNPKRSKGDLWNSIWMVLGLYTLTLPYGTVKMVASTHQKGATLS